MKESQTKRFCSCIKKVRQTLKAGAIAVCVKSVLQRRGRTLKKFRCKGNKARVLTQPKLVQEGGTRYYIQLADTITNHLRKPDMKTSIKIMQPRGRSRSH